MGDTLSKAKSALLGAKRFTKSVEGREPGIFAKSPSQLSAEKPANVTKPAPAGLPGELGVKARNVTEYRNAYPQMHDGGTVPCDGLYELKAGERVIPAGESETKVKIKLRGEDAEKFLRSGKVGNEAIQFAENREGQRELIPAGMQSRKVKANDYYLPTGEVKPQNHGPIDRAPLENTGPNPATSQAQQRVMAIAEHAPEKLYSRNRGLLKMSKSDLHDFASTPRKGLPKKAKKR